jgi:RNA polymerase sigma factor (sigma-70 family)
MESSITNEDLVQDALTILYTKYRELDFDNGILPYAYGVLDNVVKNFVKTGRRRGKILNEKMDEVLKFQISRESIEDRVNYQELVETIWSALDEMTNKDKEVLQPKLNGLSVMEIQQLLGLRRNTVDVRLYRAIQKLKKILRAKGIL